MRKLLIILLLFCGVGSDIAMGQFSDDRINELKKQLLSTSNDSIKHKITFLLAFGYRFSNVDSSLFYNDIAIGLAKKINIPLNVANSMSLKGATILESGRLPESMELQFDALNISDKINDSLTKATILNRVGNIYMELADYDRANEYYIRSKDLYQAMREKRLLQ